MFEALEFTNADSENREGRVNVYALSSCDHCREGMRLLESLGIPYRYVYVDKLPPETRIMIKKEIAGRFSRNLLFPMLEIPGVDFLFGYEEKIWRDFLAKVRIP